ncbi:hypothetical protein JTE90_027758 [Oedothorax gibbosus]|uniref:Uncharacterized protein n=1 Tax=Oedothorax gibbosus TaxID=931172 RepID=A0AAV6V790_9ARAC|nr:hypothetical protein JTE90_027758 [Oedothorax gibbosus]
MCLNSRMWLRHFRKLYKASDITEQNIGVRSFRKSYENLCEIVSLLDDAFSEMVGIWLFMILVIICVRIISVLNPLTVTTDQMMTVILLTLFRAMGTLLGSCFLGDSISSEGKNALSLLIEMARRDNCYAWNNSAFFEIQLIITKYALSPLQLTVIKFARLDRKFLMSCMGMMTTYIIISIQLYPNAMKGLRSL